MAFGNKRIENCPVTGANVANVTIDPRLKEPLLVALYGWKDEFILFLEGTREGRNVHITGIHAPEQYNGPSTCEAIDKFDPEKWLGIMHSHVNFGAFHSCTDEQGVDNAPVSLVISRKSGGDLNYEICGKVAVDLPCGEAGVLRAAVEFGTAAPLVTEWKYPTEYSLAQAIKSDCTAAYNTAKTGCEAKHLVERDYTIYNQVFHHTKERPRSYTTYGKGGVSASESKDSGAGKKRDDWDNGYNDWASTTANETSAGKTRAGEPKFSARKPDRTVGQSILELSAEDRARMTGTPADFLWVKCAYCDEDMYNYEAEQVDEYKLCYWCADYLTRNHGNDLDAYLKSDAH